MFSTNWLDNLPFSSLISDEPLAYSITWIKRKEEGNMGKFLIGTGKTEGEAKQKLSEEQRKAEASGLHPENRPLSFPDWHHKQWVASDYASDNK